MTEEQQAMVSLLGALAIMIIAAFIATTVLVGCTTAREPPWIIEQPLHYAPPEPAPAGPKPPPARPERRA